MSIKHYPELEENALRVMKARKWTLRQAEMQTGISHSTIYNLTRGRRASPELITEWAKKIKEDPSIWLTAAGYDYIQQATGQPSTDASEITRQSFHDDLPESLQRVDYLHGRTMERIQEMPPGPEYDAYVKMLEAQQEASLKAIEERLEREAEEARERRKREG